MILSLFSCYVRNGIIRFKNDDAIPNVYSIILFTDNSSENFKRKEFRWSYDNDNWSSWEKLTQSNISSINIDGQSLYLEVRYEPLNDSTVSEFNIKYNNGSRLVEVKTSGTDSSDIVERGSTQSTSIFSDRNVRVYDSDLLNGKTGNYYLQRYNQIGTQSISSIDGLQELLYEYYNGLSNVEERSSTHDASIGILRNDVDLNEASIYLLESHINDIDVSLNNLYLGTSVGELIAWVEDIESSVNFLYDYKDIQDVSILELFSQNNIQNIQISNLQSKDDSQDSSINFKVDKFGDTMTGDLITTGLQVNNDVSINGYIDASKYIHLFNFDNITSDIGDIWFDTSGRINTYAQVLDSTRDASTTNLNDRLTRSNNDYQSFPENIDAKEEDKFLIEDVSENHEKKYINGYNMRYSMTGGFGQYPAFLEDRTIFETSSQTYIQANRLITDPSANAGTYRIAWSFYGTNIENNNDYQYRIQVDDTTTIEERTQTLDSPNIYTNHSGFTQITLTSGSHNIDLDVRSINIGTTSIDDVRIEFWRIN